MAIAVEVAPQRAVGWSQGPLVPARNGLVRPLFATFAAVETAAPAVSYSFAARLAAPGGGGGGEHNGSARREP